MNKLILKITLLTVTIYFTACSTTKNTTTFTPLTAETEQAVVYIYRPSLMSNAMYSPDLYINDAFKTAINNGSERRLSLKPGKYKFEIKADKNYSALTTLSLNLNADASYFIRVDTSLKIINSTSYQPYERSFSLINVEKQQAVEEIAQCCTSRSKKTADSSEIKYIEKKTDETFSIDKTQNPFSH